ncbi:hypothetical protein ACFFX1_27590 [Dactylosporangium sucinum]|uniref:Uncharacterized protein n=1 Tax=Dactylosporangium sucinum TaxID=1424081 RepID=A0A917T261_9ACTN|nr:hypothetical protein [Dactylosporangium sucinum]GGM07249.1 hypothetical protein GCM10007977_005350 [Dactylosporangium sucinum]
MTAPVPGPPVPGPVPGPPGAASLGRVEAAVESLREVASLPLKQQVSVYADAHRTLQETLGTIEER